MSSRFGEDPFSIRDPKETVERISRFLKSHVERIGADYLLVGMSGGLDSSVTAALCSKALGGRKILGFCLPEAETRNERNIKDTKEIATMLGIKLRIIDITHLVEAAAKTVSHTKKGKIAYGNLKARLRSAVLYYFSNINRGLVVGTGDKSEMMLGYFTKYGDGACDLQPLADMYKTSVRNLAPHLGIPERIFSKPSTPELWAGQTAEGELGLPYEKLDWILWGLERWMTPKEIGLELKLPSKLVVDVRKRWIESEHKRRPPLAMKLGFRTPGQDLRIPYSL